MKISLFYKHFIVKASISVALFAFIALPPSHAYANFFSGLIAKVIGPETQASEIVPPSEDAIHNSQNVPLLESSINPDLKNIKDEPIAPALSPSDPVALSNTGTLDTDSDLEQYASSEKISTYTVKQGDTLERISKKLNISQSTILASNADLKKSDLLKVGQKLVILGAKGQQLADKTDTSDADTKKDDKPTPAKKDDVKAVAKDETSIKKDLPAQAGEPKDEGPMYVINTDLTPFNQTPIDPNPIPVPPQINLPIGGAPTPNTAPVPAESGQPAGTINGGYIWPFPAGVGRISQGLHADQAYDFAAPKNTPISAIQNGTVFIVHASGYNGGYGKYVVINFDDGRQAIFGHMNKTNVEEGQIVKQGDVIGFVGTTGQSTGNHTHIGFRGPLGNPYKGLKVNSTSIDSHD